MSTVGGGGKIIKRYVFNTSWVMLEQMLRIVSAVFVGIYIARYLGPEGFGVVNYTVAIATFLFSITRLGMDAVLVRELVAQSEKSQILLGTAFWLMLLVSMASYTLLILGLFLTDETTETKIYISIVSAGCFFTLFYIGDYYFQAEVKAKYSTICKAFVLLLMSALKIFLVFINAELKWFVVASFLDYALLGVAFLIMLLAQRQGCFFRFFDFHIAQDLLRSAWPMVLSALSILIYMRIDQVMIRNMLGLHELGIYSAATRLYEAWMMFPYVVSVSLLPLIISAKKSSQDEYRARLIQLFRILVWLSIFAALIVTLFGDYIIFLTFGEAFSDAVPVAIIVMWTSIFAAMGSVSARYFNVERMEKKFAARTVLAALANIGLNLILIPRFGILGAAWATLICTFFANYLLDWFDRDLRDLLKIKHKSLFL